MKILNGLFLVITLFCFQANAVDVASKVKSFKLLDGVVVTGAGPTEIVFEGNTTYQATGLTSAGAGASAILVQVSDDNSNWITLGTITLTLGTSATTDGFSSIASWKYVRGNVSSISGTGATVYLWMGH